MLYPNDLFTNMIRNFGFINNPSMNAWKSGTPAAAPEAAGVTASPAGASEIGETLRQNLQDQVTLMNSIASCALASTEKLVELNLNAARTSMQENSTIASQAFASNSTTDLQTIFAALPQATSTKAIAYNHHLADITADACTEIARSSHTQVTQITDRMMNLIDQASKSMPAGSENVVALTKSAIATAGSGVEQAVKTAEQAAHTIQESAETIVNDAVQRNAKASSDAASRRAH